VRNKNIPLCKLVKDHGGIAQVAKDLGVMEVTLTKWMRKEWSLQIGGKGRGRLGVKRAKRIAEKIMELSGRPIKEFFPDLRTDLFFDEKEAPEIYTNTPQWQLEDIPWIPQSNDLDQDQISCELYKLMSEVLGKREFKFLQMHFGLFGNERLTQPQIAKRYGITASCAGQVVNRALAKVKKHVFWQNGLLDRYVNDGTKRQQGYYQGDAWITKKEK